MVQEKYQRKIKRVLLNSIEKVSEMLNMYGYDYVYRTLSMEALNPELTNIFIQLYKETSVKWANMVYRFLKIEAKKSGVPGFNEVWAREASAFLSQYGIPLISTITGNMREELLKLIDEAIQEGFNEQLTLTQIIERIQLRIREYGIDKSDYWAERIARTETVRGANYGAMQGARSHSFKVNKVWIAADDNRTRPAPGKEAEFSHRQLDNQVKPLEEPFNNGENIMQPGDPKASAGNTINCRCAIGFEPVRINGKLVPK